MAEKTDKEVTVTNSAAPIASVVHNPFHDMEQLFEDFMGRGWMRPMRWDRSLFA